MSLDRQVRAFARKLEEIAAKEVPRAEASALNRSASLARTRTIRGIAAETRLKIKTIRPRVYVRRARSNKLVAKVRVYPQLISAYSQLTNAQRSRVPDGRGTNRRGVRAGGRQYDSAFIATGRHNKRQVFQRRHSTRLPLKKAGVAIQDEAVRISLLVSRRVLKQEYKRLLLNDLRFRLRKFSAK